MLALTLWRCKWGPRSQTREISSAAARPVLLDLHGSHDQPARPPLWRRDLSRPCLLGPRPWGRATKPAVAAVKLLPKWTPQHVGVLRRPFEVLILASAEALS